MAEGDNLDRWMRKISVEHAETRWLALRLDDDVKVQHEDLREIKATQRIHTAILNEHSAILNGQSAILREHSAKLDEHSAKLQEHDARFDSVDSQLQSLTQMVGQVLERLPETPCES
jgi:uncharacterized protein involved in exopolysaccharide biosynthesis